MLGCEGSWIFVHLCPRHLIENEKPDFCQQILGMARMVADLLASDCPKCPISPIDFYSFNFQSIENSSGRETHGRHMGHGTSLVGLD